MALRLVTLGHLALQEGEKQLLAGRRKVLALLAYLVRSDGAPVRRATLASIFWPDADENRSRQSLRTALTELRGAVGEGLQADTDQVCVLAGRVELDADLFERAMVDGRLESAVTLWGGEFLDGLEDVGDETWRVWLEGERASLRKRYVFALERLSESSGAAGRWVESADYAERWVAATPGDERAAIRLVTALRSSGRVTEAAARHAALALSLTEAIGRAPSTAFLKLGAPLRPETRGPGIRGLLLPDLVGREEAFAEMTNAWQEVRNGQALVIAVEGDAGMGKTRLLDEFARGLRAGGQAVVVQLRAYSAERDRPWSALRPLLDQLADAPGLAGSSPETLAALCAISPSIAERFRAVGASSPMAVDQAVARALSDIAYESPLTVIVDDAPLADQSTLGVLESLVRRPSAGVLLVLSGSAEQWDASSSLGALRQLHHVRRVILGELQRTDVRRFVASVVPISPSLANDLSDRLHAEIGGRPGALHETLGELVERRLLTADAEGRWTLSEPASSITLPVPSEMRARIRSRLEALSSDARHVLESAAVIGPRVDASLLETVASRPAPAFRGATAELLSRRLLRASAGTEHAFEFSSEAERRAVYAQIVPSTRRALHRSAARSLRSAEDASTRATAEAHRRLAGIDPRRRIVYLSAAAVFLLSVVVAGRSLLGAPAGVPEGSQLLLANVQNLTPDSTLGGALELAARIGLQQSRRISLVSSQQVNDALKRMRRPSGTIIDEEVAQEIAVRENLPAFIHVALASVDSAYLVTGRVIDVQRGRDLFTTSVAASGHSSILTSLDEVLKRVRTALGESRFTVRSAAQSLPRVTTSSLEALRLYGAGRVQWVHGELPQAKTLWVRAVEIDSGFALALANIASFYYVHGDSGIDRATGDRYLDGALAHSDRLTARERYSIVAAAARMRGTPEEAVARSRDLAEHYPERDTWYDLGSTLMRLGRYEEAIVPLRRSLQFDPRFANAWINLASAYSGASRVDSALAAYDRALAADSNQLLLGGNVNQEWGWALLRGGRAADAESVYTRAASLGDPSNRAYGMRSLAWLGIYRGRYKESAAWLSKAVALTEGTSQKLSVARNRWILGSVYVHLGDTLRARAAIARAESDLGDLATDPVFLFHLASAQLEAGDVAGAGRILKRVEQAARTAAASDQAALHLLRGLLAFAQGRPDSAETEARRSPCEKVLCGARDALLSEVWGRRGQTDSALAASTRLEENWAFGYEIEPLWRHASLRVARLALRAGDTARAVAALQRQSERWKAADADFPDLVETRRLLAQLKPR